MTVIQRLELLAEDVKKLEGEGGGGDLSAYLTKDEASNTYETQTSASSALALKADKSTTYTKTEVDEAIAGAGGGDVIVDGENVKTKNAYASAIGILIGNQAGSGYNNYQIAIGTRASAYNPGDWPIAIGYQAKANGSGIVIGSNSNDNGSNINLYDSVILGWNSTANSNNNVILGHHLTAAADNQVILGHSNEASNTQGCFIVGNGTNANPSNLIEITTPLKITTAGIEVNGTPYGQTATSTETLPSAGTGTTFDTGIEWTYIQTKNDFILDSEGFQIKFRYGFTKGSYLHYFGYIYSSSDVRLAHLELGAPTGSGTTALATWISSGAIPTT